MSDDDRDFLSRWSRQKQAARHPEPAPEPVAPIEEVEPDAEGATEPRSEADLLKALGLPDPDRLTAGADFRAFMAAGVPAALRNRALRVLWRSDPRLANLDGLVDHGEDYTDKATVKPDLKTAYRVGRGILRQMAEPAEAERSRTAEPADPPPDVADTSPEEVAAPDPNPSETMDTETTPPASDRRAKRMRFEVDRPATFVAINSAGRE